MDNCPTLTYQTMPFPPSMGRLLDTFLLKTQTIGYTRKYQLAHLLSLCCLPTAEKIVLQTDFKRL